MAKLTIVHLASVEVIDITKQPWLNANSRTLRKFNADWKVTSCANVDQATGSRDHDPWLPLERHLRIAAVVPTFELYAGSRETPCSPRPDGLPV
jgi:hypothetical protein